MRQITRLLSFQNRRCAICNKRLKESTAAVMRIDPHSGGKSDANSFAVCQTTADYVNELPLKERVFTFLHPPEDLPCFPAYAVEQPEAATAEVVKQSHTVRAPEANAMLTRHEHPLPIPSCRSPTKHTNAYAPNLSRASQTLHSGRVIVGASNERFAPCPQCGGRGGMNGSCPRCGGHGYLSQ